MIQGSAGDMMTLFTPTLKDIESVVAILAAFKLPSELALLVLDYAHYWRAIRKESISPLVLVDEDWSLDYSAAYPYFCVPVPVDADRQNVPLKIREIAFTIVSHDQGWTTESTKGTYETSSWFEVSILRSNEARPRLREPFLRRLNARRETAESITAASRIMFADDSFGLLRRPSSVMEPQRLHCTEMMEVKSEGVEEGEYAWYLQGNEVGREKSVFQGEMIKRYNVTWGCKANPIQVASEGAGGGEDFVDLLQKDDLICVWARAKVSVWCLRVQGTLAVKARADGMAETRLGEPCPRSPNHFLVHDLAHSPTSVSNAYRCKSTSLHKERVPQVKNLRLMQGGSRRRVLDPIECSERTKSLDWRSRA
jgi:hypothetical protein